MNKVVIFLLVGILTGCGIIDVEEKATSTSVITSDFEKEEVELVRSIDGDTIKVSYRGDEENIRLLLIDTPETNHPQLGVQPFGQEAKEFTMDLVENADMLELEFDIGQKRDKYQRLLAYVYADGVMVQELLVREGLARVAYVYPPNTRYVDQLKGLQEHAQGSALGIWSVENYATSEGFDKEVLEPKQEEKRVDGCQIKGNINSKGERIYHTEQSRWYEQTDPEVWFCNEKEAQEAGFRAPL
ncbi:thermonuclease family protein [Bacillus sp. 2205SS5-2]|uniref:thermonuclease family protein n=1 Tax=Bacillus sp. 2205SS5-2 TaxID=3109031 RepID=UPI003004ED93